MPTGYTAGIVDRDLTFNEFVWTCARAFGALISLRDAPTDSKIVELEPSTWHWDAIEVAKKEIKRTEKMTLEEAAEECQRDYDRAVIEYHRAVAKNLDIERKYKLMLAQVRTWNPPTPEHRRLREFMIEQITDSIKFDHYIPSLPTLQSAEEYLEDVRAVAKRDLAYHVKEWEEELRRTKERNEWIQQLAASVPMPDNIKD